MLACLPFCLLCKQSEDANHALSLASNLTVACSCKVQFSGSPGVSLQRLARLGQLLQQPAGVEAAAGRHGKTSILLVSGGQKRKTFDTLVVLQSLQAAKTSSSSTASTPSLAPSTAAAAAPVPGAPTQSLGGKGSAQGAIQAAAKPQRRRQGRQQGGGSGIPLEDAQACLQALQGVELHTAFNPFLPGQEEQQLEQERLGQKLATGLVAGVYLQAGGAHWPIQHRLYWPLRG